MLSASPESECTMCVRLRRGKRLLKAAAEPLASPEAREAFVDHVKKLSRVQPSHSVVLFDPVRVVTRDRSSILAIRQKVDRMYGLSQDFKFVPSRPSLVEHTRGSRLDPKRAESYLPAACL
jgi:hypothetical protein